jgi:hypothetical protein
MTPLSFRVTIRGEIMGTFRGRILGFRNTASASTPTPNPARGITGIVAISFCLVRTSRVHMAGKTPRFCVYALFKRDFVKSIYHPRKIHRETSRKRTALSD